MKHIFYAALMVLLSAPALRAQSEKDLKELAEITRGVYEAVSFENADAQSLEQLHRYLIPKALLINNNGPHHQLLNVDAFIFEVKAQIMDGTLSSFHEVELKHETEIFGNVAHRFSTYQAEITTGGNTYKIMGINSIQFIKTMEGWKVSSIAWNDEDDTLKIPAQYLPEEK